MYFMFYGRKQGASSIFTIILKNGIISDEPLFGESTDLEKEPDFFKTFDQASV